MLTAVRVLPLITVILLFVVINLTDPTKHVASILLVFVLIYMFFASSFFIVLHELLHRLPWRSRIIRPSKMPHKRAYSIASALAFIPVILLAMRSLQQIRLFDIVLVCVLTSLVIFYIVKRT